VRIGHALTTGVRGVVPAVAEFSGVTVQRYGTSRRPALDHHDHIHHRDRGSELKLLTVVGARPQFVKAAMVSRAIARRRSDGSSVSDVLVHTGQHFDDNMSTAFFNELDIVAPAHNLAVHGGPHGEMTGRMMVALEPVIADEAPDWVVVHGDTNSTLAGALVASKMRIPVAHVEAGLRSHNRDMPEETNRVVADALSEVLFAPTRVAVENLRAEGVDPRHIAEVGDVMFDATLHYSVISQRDPERLSRLGVDGSFILVTIHRAENTDDSQRLRGIVDALVELADRSNVVVPLHPRTREALIARGWLELVSSHLSVLEPVGYLDMLALTAAADVVVTDSGGLQKESYFLGTPCVTVRDETEWKELIDIGVNELAGPSPAAIGGAVAAALDVDCAPGTLYGAGHSAELIVDRLLQGADRMRS
jgi:UDP-GlcNAc3NAcA epimerase